VKQAETQRDNANRAINARLTETYQWILSPRQDSPDKPIVWESIKMNGQDSLAVRVSKKLKNEDLLFSNFSGSNLRIWLDKIPLWRGDQVEVKQLAEDFAKYNYLPRLCDPSVVIRSVEDGIANMTWEVDTFAFADSYDDSLKRFRGLKAGNPSGDRFGNEPRGLVIKSDVAKLQLISERELQNIVSESIHPSTIVSTGATVSSSGSVNSSSVKKKVLPTRFYGTVTLDSTRVGRDAGRIADEVISHLVSLVGSGVKVSLEIEADIPTGVPDNVVRTVTENSQTLKFNSHGFEE